VNFRALIPRWFRSPAFRHTPIQRKVSALVAHLRTLDQCDMPLVHRFTPGLYSREISMPAGALVVSYVHKTEHQFVILEGSLTVWDENGGTQKLSAPHVGITKPGTRRVLYIHEDCVWATFHPSTETNVEKLEAALVYNPDLECTFAQSEIENIKKEIVCRLQLSEQL